MILSVPFQVIAKFPARDEKSAIVHLAPVTNQDPNSASRKYFHEPASGGLELHTVKAEVAAHFEVGQSVYLTLSKEPIPEPTKPQIDNTAPVNKTDAGQ